ncbi:hypothetical protein [Endozoicomonas sp. 8E]|uniref:hypothetical protein n=1 Tax=Endozoicomonas sp. 8E TaxID=3035692 RepID=UPI00293929D7|nr:hypothetical protein [Endozoicomonas sp. 8E]WOG30032.1 hypothetical protein P6910_10370 [Endozoicomonas sp. 8E]
MIRDMETAHLNVKTTEQVSTEKTPPDKPVHCTQKQEITPFLKTDGEEIHEQQVFSLSCRDVAYLKTPSRPYPGTSRCTSVYMDNNPQGNYSASYANLPETVTPETVRIGNQQLITLATSQPFVDSNLAAERRFLELYHFDFLVNFLYQNNQIEYIVDIGCNRGTISLLMQNYLNEKGLRIKVIPVDVRNDYANEATGARALPINLIPAQEIANASPATTLFTATHPFTGSGSGARRLNKEIREGITDFYLTALIKNNPGCFVLTTEDPYVSSPQHYIPPELVYSKHYYAYPNFLIPKACETEKAIRQAKAAEMNAENSDIHRLNQLLAKLPEMRDSYQAEISALKDQLQPEIVKKPDRFWPDEIFRLYLDKRSRIEGVRSYDDIQYDVKRNALELRCWHVFRQDMNTSEAYTCSPPEQSSVYGLN